MISDHPSFRKHWLCSVFVALLFIALPGADAAWGANGDVVFSQEGQIRSINPANSHEAPITSDEYFNTQPAVSPDGQTVAYARLPQDFSVPNQIYTISINGGTPQPLVTMEGADIDPAWSPNGTEVAFAHQEPGGGVSNIYKINIATKTITQLTDLPDEPTDAAAVPAWSMDGSRIAFIESTDSSGFGVAVMNSDGSNMHKIVPTGMVADVAWSPIEERIFYSRDERTSTSDFQIYSVSPDGSNEKEITDDLYEKPEFAISPDGTRLVFMRSDKERELAGNYSLWTMNIDGSDQSQLTIGPNDADPTWAFGDKDSTQLALTSSANPVSFGSSVSFKAVVKAVAPGTGTPTGTVTFTEGSKTLAAVALSGGSATYSTSSLAVGSHTITATYGGSANYNSSSANTIVMVQSGCTRTFAGPIYSGLTVPDGQRYCLSKAQAYGSMRVMAGGALTLSSSTVDGKLAASGAVSVQMCGSTVNGSVSIEHSTGALTIGDGTSSCAGDLLNGSLNVTDNDGAIVLAQNTIRGSVGVLGNTQTGTVGPVIESNKITDSLNCSSNKPPPTNNATKNTVTGSKTGQCLSL